MIVLSMKVVIIVVLSDEEPRIATWHLYFQCTTEGCCGGTRH